MKSMSLASAMPIFRRLSIYEYHFFGFHSIYEYHLYIYRVAAALPWGGTGRRLPPYP